MNQFWKLGACKNPWASICHGQVTMTVMNQTKASNPDIPEHWNIKNRNLAMDLWLGSVFQIKEKPLSSEEKNKEVLEKKTKIRGHQELLRCEHLAAYGHLCASAPTWGSDSLSCAWVSIWHMLEVDAVMSPNQAVVLVWHTCTFRLCWMTEKGVWIVGKEGKKGEILVTVVWKFLIGVWIWWARYPKDTLENGIPGDFWSTDH